MALISGETSRASEALQNSFRFSGVVINRNIGENRAGFDFQGLILGRIENSPSMTKLTGGDFQRAPEKLAAPAGTLRFSPPYMMGRSQRGMLGTG